MCFSTTLNLSSRGSHLYVTPKVTSLHHPLYSSLPLAYFKIVFNIVVATTPSITFDPVPLNISGSHSHHPIHTISHPTLPDNNPIISTISLTTSHEQLNPITHTVTPSFLPCPLAIEPSSSLSLMVSHVIIIMLKIASSAVNSIRKCSQSRKTQYMECYINIPIRVGKEIKELYKLVALIKKKKKLCKLVAGQIPNSDHFH